MAVFFFIALHKTLFKSTAVIRTADGAKTERRSRESDLVKKANMKRKRNNESMKMEK